MAVKVVKAKASEKTNIKKVNKKTEKPLEKVTQKSPNFFEQIKTDLDKNPKKKWAFAAIVGVVVLAILAYVNLSSFILATVNGKPITRVALINELEKQGGQQVLESLVIEELIKQEAQKNNVVVAQEDIDAEIAVIEESLKAQNTDLDTALSFQGQTRADFEENIRRKVIVQKLLGDRINVDQQEVEEFYEQNKEAYGPDVALEEVRGDIETRIAEQKLSDEYFKWIEELKASATVNYLRNL